MARPRSDERQRAIMSAAARIIASEGLGASTAAIAKEAGVSNGSLFTYFDTKADLLNRLYIELKTEVSAAATREIPEEGDARSQLFDVWRHWLFWALEYPEKRRALAHLGISDDITEESRQAGHRAMAGIAALLERCRREGPLKDAPATLASSLISALAETTMDFMATDRTNAAQHCATSFEAVWRMLA